MSHELYWGFPVILYLFLAGVGAGALTVSASVFLRGGGGAFGGSHFSVGRYGAFIAPLPVMIGCGLLVFELGSFQAGDWFKWLNLYKTITLSPMSIGTWLLTVFILTSLAYAYTFMRPDAAPGDEHDKLRKALAWINVPLGIGVAVYTGVLLGAMPSRPFWNSPIIAMLFLLSALSTGVAVLLLVRALTQRQETEAAASAYNDSAYLLTASDVLLIGFELLVVFLFLMFAHLTVGNVRDAVAVVLPGGSMAPLFWIGFVVVGLLVPVLIELFYVIPKLLYQQAFTLPRGVEIAVPVIVLTGGFLLRYVVVVAGQITGPVGI
ncbi:MAG: NrfD/PsrC family molybdoenzyme membrane anchor subunit [Acidiferrobacterales bacterium]